VPADGLVANDILKNADLALYRAKAEGRGTYRFFEPMMDAQMQERRHLEMDLRHALTNRELELFFQPLINMASERVCSFEALLRWHHPSRGLVQPGDFIPLAEEVGLIIPIGEWVLDQACHEAAKWPQEIRLAVNVSVTQFRSPHLVEATERALRSSGLAPGRLDIEITESVLMQDTEATLAILGRLRDLGARISMDDFGTGYSSLSYLRSFPFHKIKIDQCFVRDLDTSAGSIAIIRAIVHLGHALGMSVTAEGVETEQQLAQLKAEGCTEGQGYLFSRACPADKVPDMIATLNQTTALPFPRSRTELVT
jgi:EAL domain-containing protein (putative c-di-GMP-specific phosphodiesterase class I)